MTYDLTRARALQLWFLLVGVVAALWAAFGPAIDAGTVILILGLSVVPPGMMMLLWPGVQPPTAGEIIRGGRSE